MQWREVRQFYGAGVRSFGGGRRNLRAGRKFGRWKPVNHKMNKKIEPCGAEYNALKTSAGVLNLSSRSRLVLTGADRVRFLHGQVTNDIKRLRVGEGCYAALTTAKGKME